MWFVFFFGKKNSTHTAAGRLVFFLLFVSLAQTTPAQPAGGTSPSAGLLVYHQGTQVVEKSFNPTWVGAPQFYIYISRRPTVGRHLTCLCMESKAICMESEAIYI